MVPPGTQYRYLPLPADARLGILVWRHESTSALAGGCAMSVADRIEINPNVMLGKPVIRGTRVPVELILRKLGEGATAADLVDAYPKLTPDDIRAALVYAADTVAD